MLSLAWVMDRWGWRAGLAYCALLSIVGRTLCAAAQDVGMFIVGRFFDGCGTFATFIAGKCKFSCEFWKIIHSKCMDADVYST